MTDINYGKALEAMTLVDGSKGCFVSHGKHCKEFYKHHAETIRSALQLAAAMEKVPENCGMKLRKPGTPFGQWECKIYSMTAPTIRAEGSTPLAAIEAAIKALPQDTNTPITG